MSERDFTISDEGTDDLARFLQQIADRAADPEPAMQDVATHVAAASDLLFDDEEDPWGRAWEPLAERTRRQRRGTSEQILRDAGHLRASIVSHAQGSEATVGAGSGPAHDYARIHLFGGRAGRNRATRIPARPYLPLTPAGAELPQEWRDDVAEILSNFVTGGAQ